LHEIARHPRTGPAPRSFEEARVNSKSRAPQRVLPTTPMTRDGPLQMSPFAVTIEIASSPAAPRNDAGLTTLSPLKGGEGSLQL